jgi:hypothetical protein
MRPHWDRYEHYLRATICRPWMVRQHRRWYGPFIMAIVYLGPISDDAAYIAVFWSCEEVT